MIAYFAPLPTALSIAIAHKLYFNHDESAVLYIDEEMYATRELGYITNSLKEENIFSDVIMGTLVCPQTLPYDVDNETAESAIIDHYNNFFDKTKYSLSDYSAIYVICDYFACEFNIYFNIMHIRYTWIESIKNLFCVNADNMSMNGCFRKLHTKYKTLSPFSQFSDAFVIADSDKTLNELKNYKNKEIILYDKGKCFSDISIEDRNKIYKAFRLDEILQNNSGFAKSLILIKNSNFFYKSGFEASNKSQIVDLCIKDNDIYEFSSLLDNICIDLFCPDCEKIYIKSHIHDFIPQERAINLYGEGAVSLPNAPFEFMQLFFEDRNIVFESVIGYMSSSLESIKYIDKNNVYALGLTAFEMWWYFISLYVILLFSNQIKFKRIYANNVISVQLKNLARKLNYNIEIIEEEKIISNVLKDSLLIVDLSKKPADEIKIDPTFSAIAFINDGLTDNFIDSNRYETFAPICINKEKMKKTVPDIFLIKETIWFYSENSDIRKQAREFSFEKNLQHIGLKIYSSGISLSDSIELFRNRKNFNIVEKINQRLIEAERKIENLKMFVQNPSLLITMLKGTNNIDEYLDILDAIRYKYVILLAVRDTPGNCLAASTIDKVKRLGFSDFTKQLWVMYTGMIGKGVVICDKKGDNPEDKVEFTHTDTNSNKRFELRSQAWRNGNMAEIVIDQNNYAVNTRGINIVVYDIDNDIVIDSIGYDRHYPNERFVRNV